MSEIPVAEGVAVTRKTRARPGHNRRFVGVSRARTGKWIAGITADGKQVHLGTFETAEDAARARDARALLLLGPTARLNFPVAPVAPPGARAVPLTRGMWALVDEADYGSVSRWRWQATRGGRGGWYARRAYYPDGRNGPREYIRMHREILGAAPGVEVDHANNDGLDNRRENLRPCSSLENARNQPRNEKNSSGFKGVSLDKRSGKWRAYITIDGKHRHLKLTADKYEAARAYDAAATAAFGEFAKTNAMLGLLDGAA